MKWNKCHAWRASQTSKGKKGRELKVRIAMKYQVDYLRPLTRGKIEIVLTQENIKDFTLKPRDVNDERKVRIQLGAANIPKRAFTSYSKKNQGSRKNQGNLEEKLRRLKCMLITQSLEFQKSCCSAGSP